MSFRCVSVYGLHGVDDICMTSHITSSPPSACPGAALNFAKIGNFWTSKLHQYKKLKIIWNLPQCNAKKERKRKRKYSKENSLVKFNFPRHRNQQYIKQNPEDMKLNKYWNIIIARRITVVIAGLLQFVHEYSSYCRITAVCTWLLHLLKRWHAVLTFFSISALHTVKYDERYILYLFSLNFTHVMVNCLLFSVFLLIFV